MWAGVTPCDANVCDAACLWEFVWLCSMCFCANVCMHFAGEEAELG
jgi:hypothetical protein